MGDNEGRRMARAQQRFQSLSFEDDDEDQDEEAAPAPPPEYAHIGRRNTHRISSSVPSPPVSSRSV